MKFLLIENQDGLDAPAARVVVCDTTEQRDKATLAAIFGEEELAEEHAAEGASYLRELRCTGAVEFEGDPGLQWLDAEDVVAPSEKIPINQVGFARSCDSLKSFPASQEN